VNEKIGCDIMVIKVSLESRKRWDIIFRDEGRWLCGLYVPEHTSREQVKRLERHEGPELFYLVKGRIVLVLSSDGKNVIEVLMEKGMVYVVEEWHNAFRPDGVEGVSLVVERADVRTEFLNIES
jgi:hypothetical protein